MRSNGRQLSDLTEADLRRTLVWVGSPTDDDETTVVPAKKTALKAVNGKLAACEFKLSGGTQLFGVMANLTDNLPLNAHLASAAFLIHGSWFFLARYHDADVKRHGPKALAGLLGRPVDAVFPIKYNLMHRFRPPTLAQCGVILAAPPKKLTRAQIIALAVP
jgi:hypothetical protein